MAHHIALVEITHRPWTAGICFAASQVERCPILFTGSHLCVQRTWRLWWDSDLHKMETQKNNLNNLNNLNDWTKSIWKKKTICSESALEGIWHLTSPRNLVRGGNGAANTRRPNMVFRILFGDSGWTWKIFKKTSWHVLFHFIFQKKFSLELRVFFGSVNSSSPSTSTLATPWAKAPQLARTAKLGISLETTWCRDPHGRVGGKWGVGRGYLEDFFPWVGS